ncbi:CarD family transcriptional regulator [Lederbergia wuyishanensis]|uniref:CarD family transcriptional regulator n=1 Tax=Lederbergia wuyishanensis TaxID=1347903 RepID=A0ABU0D689_9BACI|nr:CarD family transcriptional regulator [Lederbergia wuyishanensis]MCJ8008667.1 CarD family transcriptional regulator [Lederbergia wuyishanensis]MDQ0343914.1 CarD family transcriptional regulator [Lederbergia wuyishanensis]
MYIIGDLVIYSTHGICKIDDICEKTISGENRKYYVMHPIENNHQLTISIPINNEKVFMHDLINKEEAIEVLQSFKSPGTIWEEQANQRHKLFSDIVKTGNRKEIARMINTLIRKKIEVERNGHKLYEQDRKLLTNTTSILFKEMAISLNKNVDEIKELVIGLIKGKEIRLIF